MDPSTVKLLEEDKDESMHSEDDVDALQERLSQEIGGNNNTSSQQFAAWNDGIGDANTNLHILENTQIKEQQRSVIGNQNQELKRQKESQSQHNPPQDHRQPGQPWENPFHVPQASNIMQSRNSSNSNELERPQPQSVKQQNMSSQGAHRMEESADRVNHGRKKVQVLELLRILLPQVDTDRRMQLFTLLSKFRREEITKEAFVRHMRNVIGDQMTRLAISQILQLQQGNMGIKEPGRPNHYRESVTSAEICAKKSDPGGVHVNQLLSTSTGTLSSSEKLHDLQRSHMENNQSVGSNGVAGATNSTMSTVPNFERPTSVDGPSRVQSDPISHFQSNSPLPLYSAPSSSLLPSSKKQKLCGTSLDQRINEQLNDVTAFSGINLMDGQVSEASRRVGREDEEERTILQKVPLQRKLAKIIAKTGLKHINDDVERCLSACVEERMRRLLSNIIRVSMQRIDAEKFRNHIYETSDVRKQINEMNQKAKEDWERKHSGEEKNEENDTSKEDNRSRQVRANIEEERAKANLAVHAAVGGNDVFLKWKLMVEERQKSSSGPGTNSKKPSAETGGRRFGNKQGLPEVVRSISLKDVIAVLEREPRMSRSTLLYCLYERNCSDVRTQDKA